MQQPIVGFRRDDESHWVAVLACGHSQHVRHDPPWQDRSWVITAEGRRGMLGFPLDCILCDRIPCDQVSRGQRMAPGRP